MDCNDVRPLLDAYLDTELDLTTSLEVEKHLADCPDCQQILRSRQQLRQGLASDALYFRAPTRLRATVAQTSSPGLIDRFRHNNWLGMVATFAIGVLLTAGLLPRLTATSAFSTTTQEVVASHIRSLMAGHLYDVESTDQHTVKPWFDGKLDFAPVVLNLPDQGFPLIGGRLDYLDQRSVTALVYQHDKHIINLFEWPATGTSDSSLEIQTLQGYHVINWTQSGVAYWAVSDIEPGLLQTFARTVQSQSG